MGAEHVCVVVSGVGVGVTGVGVTGVGVTGVGVTGVGVTGVGVTGVGVIGGTGGFGTGTIGVLVVIMLISEISKVPEEVNSASALESVVISRDEILLVSELNVLPTTLKVFCPFNHFGFPGTVESGINNDPISLPLLSDIKRILVIVATAPDVFPISLIPIPIDPKNSTSVGNCKERVSTFNTEDEPE